MIDGLKATKRVALTNFKSAVTQLKREVILDRQSFPEARDNPYALKMERTLIETVKCLEKLVDYLEAEDEDVSIKNKFVDHNLRGDRDDW